MALLLKNVGKTFENTGQATLKNINLEIKTGRVPLCSWEKRMRQSTLLNLIGALDSPTSGKVLIAGKDLFP